MTIQEQEEKWVFERFIRLYTTGHITAFKKHESPDFIIESEGKNNWSDKNLQMAKKRFSIILLICFLIPGLFSSSGPKAVNEEYVNFQVDPKKDNLKLYWKDDKKRLFKSIGNLKSWLEGKGHQLVFAMNAGMYKPDNAPQGLFIEEQKVVVPLDTSSGNGNFYLKPNGVFYTTADKKAVVCRTEDFKNSKSIRYATQSGPMLLIDGKIHAGFTKGSKNVHIRNGVGILANGKVLFAMSKKEVNLYDFANYFKRSGCKNALYLDGFVSRAYLPEKQWVQTDGNFGVIIGVTASK
jgi:uncharacterized protein YigE (DUF2233 family)